MRRCVEALFLYVRLLRLKTLIQSMKHDGDWAPLPSGRMILTFHKVEDTHANSTTTCLRQLSGPYSTFYSEGSGAKRRDRL